MKLESIKSSTKELIIQEIDDIATHLMNHVFHIGKSTYRLTEFESKLGLISF